MAYAREELQAVLHLICRTRDRLVISCNTLYRTMLRGIVLKHCVFDRQLPQLGSQ